MYDREAAARRTAQDKHIFHSALIALLLKRKKWAQFGNVYRKRETRECTGTSDLPKRKERKN